MILLVALVLLLAVGVGILAYYYAAPRSSQPHRTSTATTRSINPLTATATTLHAIYVQATIGTPTIADPLSQQNSDNWDEDPNCAFTGGTYHATAMQADTFFACNAVATHFDNFAYQVQMTLIKGDYGGIIFRSDSAAANTYIFTIDQSGSYSFTVYQNDNELQVLSNGVSTAFRSGLNQPNVITVVAQGSTFYLYANGLFVTSASDSTYRAGEIGVLAGENAHSTEVAFQDVKVWRL